MDFGSIAHYKPFHKGCRVDEVGLVVDGCFVDWGAWNQCAARDGVGFLVKVLNANEGGVIDKFADDCEIGGVVDSDGCWHSYERPKSLLLFCTVKLKKT